MISNPFQTRYLYRTIKSLENYPIRFSLIERCGHSLTCGSRNKNQCLNLFETFGVFFLSFRSLYVWGPFFTALTFSSSYIVMENRGYEVDAKWESLARNKKSRHTNFAKFFGKMAKLDHVLWTMTKKYCLNVKKNYIREKKNVSVKRKIWIQRNFPQKNKNR